MAGKIPKVSAARTAATKELEPYKAQFKDWYIQEGLTLSEVQRRFGDEYNLDVGLVPARTRGPDRPVVLISSSYLDINNGKAEDVNGGFSSPSLPGRFVRLQKKRSKVPWMLLSTAASIQKSLCRL